MYQRRFRCVERIILEDHVANVGQEDPLHAWIQRLERFQIAEETGVQGWEQWSNHAALDLDRPLRTPQCEERSCAPGGGGRDPDRDCERPIPPATGSLPERSERGDADAIVVQQRERVGIELPAEEHNFSRITQGEGRAEKGLQLRGGHPLGQAENQVRATGPAGARRADRSVRRASCERRIFAPRLHGANGDEHFVVAVGLAELILT